MTLFSKFDGGAAYTPNYSENILKDPPCVHLFGSSYAVIEGCRGVLSFAPGALLLSCSGGNLLVRGSEIEISGMNSSSLTVVGRISGIEILEKGRSPK